MVQGGRKMTKIAVFAGEDKFNCNYPALCHLFLWLGLAGMAAGQPPTQPNAVGKPIYVQPRSLTLWERTSLANVGNRLTTQGLERMILSGKLSRYGAGSSVVSVTSELPDKIRVDQASAPGKALTLNGGSPGANVNLSDDDKDLLESFYADTIDQFFLGKTQGVAYRLIGGHVRADDGKAKNYAGPFYRVHQLYMSLQYRNETGIRLKNYVFDTNGGLLAAVKYLIVRGNSKVNVSVEYTGWRVISGQTVPSTIRRVENGSEVWRFDISSATFGGLTNDSSFKVP
jgi:hypothetical protein